MITTVPWQLEGSRDREEDLQRADGGVAPGDLRRGFADDPADGPRG